MQVEHIALSEIFADADFNCRGDISPITIKPLADDIQARGLLQPVAVMISPNGPLKYKLLAGYRRYLAHKMLGRNTIPTIVHPPMDEVKAVLFNLSENLQREDLNILQEAKVVDKLRKMGLSETACAEALPGKSRGWVQVRVMLLTLPTEIQAECATGVIGQADIRRLYSIVKAPFENEQKRMDVLFEAARKMKKDKEKGVKTNVVQRLADKHGKTRRSVAEIDKMMGHLMNNGIPAGFWSRCLAWAAGSLSTDELFDVCEEMLKAKNLQFRREIT